MISDARGPSSAARYARGPSATARPYFLGAHIAPKTFKGPKYGCRVFRILLNFHIFDPWGGEGSPQIQGNFPFYAPKISKKCKNENFWNGNVTLGKVRLGYNRARGMIAAEAG